MQFNVSILGFSFAAHRYCCIKRVAAGQHLQYPRQEETMSTAVSTVEAQVKSDMIAIITDVETIHTNQPYAQCLK